MEKRYEYEPISGTFKDLELGKRVYPRDAADRLNALEAEEERAYQVLEAYGVPRGRAGSVGNGIDVFAIRHFKAARISDDALLDMHNRTKTLEAENTELRKRVKELVISNLEYVMADTEILREVLMLNPLLKSQIRAVLSYAEDARGLIIGDAALAGGKE